MYTKLLVKRNVFPHKYMGENCRNPVGFRGCTRYNSFFKARAVTDALSLKKALL